MNLVYNVERSEVDSILLMVTERVSKILRSANESYTFYKEVGENSNLIQFTVLDENKTVKSVYTFFVTNTTPLTSNEKKIYKLMMYVVNDHVKRKRYTYYIANRHNVNPQKEFTLGPDRNIVWHYVDMALHEWYGYGSVSI